MIFWDAEKSIEEAIESVFAQTYAAWRLLLVDDGSTDGSTVIAQRYAEQYPQRVCYLEHSNHQNRGMSASRNLGLRNATGEYVAFLDADDIWLPDKLEQQVAILRDQPEAAMIYGPTLWWYSWTGKPEDQGRDFVHELGVEPNTLIQPPRLLVHFIQNGSISPCTCSVLVRRAAVERLQGFEESFKGLYEDQVFFAKLAYHEPIFVASHCLAYYRQHPGSNCSRMQATGQEQAARQMFLNWLSGYLSRQAILHPEVRRVLQKELRKFRYPGLNRLLHFARHSMLGHMYRRALQWRRQTALRWTSMPFIRQLRCLRFRRLQPLNNGRQRGTPIVRYYWARFLQRYQSDIHGHALEVGSTTTIRQYGGAAVTQADAVDLEAHSSEVTLVADISRADHLLSNIFDCFVNQFTMHLIFDVEAALYHSIRILKPGGVLLINFPCVDYYFPYGLDMGTGQPLFMYWWFTPIQVENLLRRVGLSDEDYTVELYGNLFTRVAYQMNMPAEELSQRELTFMDPGHPLLICARVVKPAGWHADKPDYQTPWKPEVTPAQWNPTTGHYAI